MTYNEVSPENNYYQVIIADITHKCNMTCKNCYIPNRDHPDMDLERFKDFLSRLPAPITIRLIGAEPTMNRQLPEFIKAIKDNGHRMGLLTNGLRLSHEKYLKMLMDYGLNVVYISMNGVDNDDWYEAIDEMRCAKKKLQAFSNLIKNNVRTETGTIIASGINEEAPARLLHLVDTHDVKDILIRIKNVGQIGRQMEDDSKAITMKELVSLCATQFNISEDYIWEFKEKSGYAMNKEQNTVLFPLEYGARTITRGRWIKLTNWISDKDAGIPDPLSERRGRVTQDFNVAPFFEHVKENEFGY